MSELQISLEQLNDLDVQDLEELYEAVTEFDDIPVDINTFLDGAKYLGSYFDGTLYPYWRKTLQEIFPSIHYSPYWLCCIKGSVGGGKTTVACVGMLYDLHKLLCHKNPQKVLGGIPSDKIEFAIFNVTLTLATDVVWDKISQMFSASDYFSRLMEVSKKRRRDETLFPKRIDFFSGSRVGHSLGRHTFSVILDEANFEVISGQVRKTFYSLLRRMETRFMEVGGGFPGKIWIVSSETDKSSVLNNLINEYKGQPGVYVCQPSLWDVKPEKYRGKKFKVYKGSDLRPPVIIDETNIKQYENEEENIIEVPEEHRHDFEASINDALRDLAGVSTGSRYKLFKLKDKMTQALCVNLLFPEVMELDFYDETDQIHSKTLIPSYFDRIAYPQYPRFLHMDIAIGGDRLGLSCCYISRYKEVKRRDITTFDAMIEAVPELVVEFSFAIQAKPGQQIPLFKVRSFILWLVSKGYSFGMISSDLGSAMAADMLQLLKRLGFNTQDISVDKTAIPYMKLRSLVYEELIYMPASKLLRTELENLEVSPDGMKVDHPEKLSKDLADSCCGSVISAIRNGDQYKVMYINLDYQKPGVGVEVKRLFWPEVVDEKEEMYR